MNIERLSIEELYELQIKIDQKLESKNLFWSSLPKQQTILKNINQLEKELKKVTEPLKEQIERVKSKEQKELEKLGYTIVIYSDFDVGIINYNIKYDESSKYYLIKYNKHSKAVNKGIDEVSDDDLIKVAKILNAKVGK